LIGLQLELATELQEQDAQSLFGKAAELLRTGDEDTERDEANRAADRAGVLLRRVARGDVTRLVPQHAGELCFIVEERKNAASDVDIAARQRERVDHGRIDHGVVPRESGTLGDHREAHPDAADISLEICVVVDAHLLLHLRIGFLPGRDLLRLAHQVDLPLAGSRIGRTCCNQCDCNDRELSKHEPATPPAHPTARESSRRSASTRVEAADAAGRR
jgi:hypothetical protein